MSAIGRAVTRPILPSADLGITSAFYGGLGFEEVGRWPDEYLIVRDRHDIELHFWFNPRADRWTNDVACWVGFGQPDDVRGLYGEWSATPLPRPAELRPPTELGHLVEFQLIDQHGNLVRVGALRLPGDLSEA